MIEDSLNGILAAKSARMKCIAVPERLPASPKLSIADVVIGSLTDVNDAVIAELYSSTFSASLPL